MSRPNQDTDKRVTERIRKEARFYRPTKTILCEAADRIEELEAQIKLLEMTKDAWRSDENITANQCIWDVTAILDGHPPTALAAIKGVDDGN